ncbi:4-carboxymuconolactone decarboxylase [Bacillus sp. 0209A]|uniref:4-carboxymuconolactone decarboxylase n=1 Tax=unclassified Bacillus (in: firmicutes) TaxID=185979 RepID=UPI000B45093E|nr:carboxymuconolactone decarboxylase family protein [Bacillus sp. RHFS10]
MAKKQTAGRDIRGKSAQKFAQLNDDVLFGDILAREEELSPRDRSMITVSVNCTGDVINIPPHVKHWHGATKDSWFAHLAITPGETVWLEPVHDDVYHTL